MTTVQIYVTVTIRHLAGYLVTTGNLLTAAVAGTINALDIGAENGTIYLNRLWAPAGLKGDIAEQTSGLPVSSLDALALTYVVRSISIGLAASPTGTNDVQIPFFAAAACVPANINLVVT